MTVWKVMLCHHLSLVNDIVPSSNDGNPIVNAHKNCFDFHTIQLILPNFGKDMVDFEIYGKIWTLFQINDN